MFRARRGTWVAVAVMGTLVAPSVREVGAAPLTKAQQKCAVIMAARLGDAAAAGGADAFACLARAAKGKLAGTIESCVAGVPPGKSAGAAGKVEAAFAKQCAGATQRPPFGVSDAVAVNAAGAGIGAAVLHDVMGADLDLAAIRSATDVPGAKCQLGLVKAIGACRAAMLKAFVGCVKTGVKRATAPIDEANDVAACIGADPKGAVAKACDLLAETSPGKGKVDVLRKTLDASCLAKGVSPSAALPRCGAADRETAHGCVARALRCRTCLGLTAAAEVTRDCDAFDDGLGNGSCPASTPLLPLLTSAPAPFAVLVAANRATGVPGTTFELTATVTGNIAAIASYAWRVDGVTSTATGATVQFTFAAAGDVAIDVVVTDMDGGSATDGILLKVFDPGATPPARVAAITPDAGMPGTLVQLTSDALNAGGGHATVKVGAGTAFEPFRPALGAASFQIPPEAAAGLVGPTPVTITLLVDGQAADTFPFTLSPVPALPGTPGALLEGSLAAAVELLAENEGDLAAALTELQPPLPAPQRAALLALLGFAGDRLNQTLAALLPRLAELPADVRAVLDRALVANGAATNVKARRTAEARNAADVLIDRLCRFHDRVRAIERLLDQANQSNETLALLIGQGTVGDDPLYRSVSVLLLDLGVIADVLGLLEDMVPEVEDEIEVTATPGTLANDGDRASVRVRAHLDSTGEVCGVGNLEIYRELADRAAQRLARSITLPRLARLFAERVFYLPAPGAPSSSEHFESLGGLLQYVRSRIFELTFRIFAVTELDGLLTLIKDRLCQPDAEGLLLQPTAELLTVDPAGGGVFSNAQERAITFACTDGTNGPVRISAERTCGVGTPSSEPHMLHGETQVLCGDETCGEDASASVETVLATKQLLDGGFRVCENTPQDPGFPIFTRTASLRFKNTHPSRTVAVSFVIVDSSNAARFDSPPCAGAQCDNVLGRCFVFLQPGETSPELLYNCEVESSSPVVDGSSPCVTGNARIEGRVIAQAAYCTFGSAGKNVFCEDAGRFLQEHEAAHASFAPIETACP